MTVDIDALVGRVVGGFRLEKLIGRGAMGAVFLGRGLDDAIRAIKVLVPPPMLNAQQQEEFRRRFAREEQVMRSLKHPHILFVEASGEDIATGSLYLVMPYITTGTLAQRLTNGPLAFGTVVNYVRELAAAVDFANDLGIIHRDIKPGNVLVNADDHVLLSDFGIVKLYEAGSAMLTSTGEVIGTPEYMAPEQARGEPVTRAADIYSLGMVTYQLVTGKLAFEAPSLMALLLQIAQNPPPPPRSRRPDLPEAAQNVILRSLAKVPMQRYSRAGQFAEALAQALQPGAAVPPPTIGVVPAAPTIATPPPMYGTPPQLAKPASYPPQPQPAAPASYPPRPPIGAQYPPQSAPNAYPPRPPAGALYPPQQVVTGRPPMSAPMSPYGAPPVAVQPYPYPGYSPAPAPRPQRPTWPIIVIASLIALVVVIAVIVNIASHGGTSTPPTYSAHIPGPCNGNSDWVHFQATQLGVANNGYTCLSDSLQLTNAPASPNFAAVYWKNPKTQSDFTISVTISHISSGCAGIGFFQQSGAGYNGFICSDGSWKIAQYDASGNYISPPPAIGNSTAGDHFTVKLAVTSSTVSFSLNGTLEKAVDRASGISPDLIDVGFDDRFQADSANFVDYTYLDHV